MIFVTVGTDQPFDRMVKVVDQWAGERSRTDVFAQIGAGGWKPTNVPFSEFLHPPEFSQRFASADVIVGHAGMGTILSALKVGKPILIMPKKASLGEHRNEHQMATARRMREMGKVDVAFDEDELWEKLDQIERITARERIMPVASGGLIDEIRQFIFQTHP
jgi:UDP-N-acetylglucosamine transferase subunit ALG13